MRIPFQTPTLLLCAALSACALSPDQVREQGMKFAAVHWRQPPEHVARCIQKNAERDGDISADVRPMGLGPMETLVRVQNAPTLYGVPVFGGVVGVFESIPDGDGGTRVRAWISDVSGDPPAVFKRLIAGCTFP